MRSSPCYDPLAYIGDLCGLLMGQADADKGVDDQSAFRICDGVGVFWLASSAFGLIF